MTSAPRERSARARSASAPVAPATTSGTSRAVRTSCDSSGVRKAASRTTRAGRRPQFVYLRQDRRDSGLFVLFVRGSMRLRRDYLAYLRNRLAADFSLGDRPIRIRVMKQEAAS